MHSSPRIQAHTFIRWMNNKLVKAHKPLVRSLVRDLQTALPLVALVEVCHGEALPFEYHDPCETEEKRTENWARLTEFLVEEKVIDEDIGERIVVVRGGSIRL